ncbi:MAG TPA: hypothetical protein VM368_08155, partial [Flavisolibacter sp.]|nr:hypothetical protein [Flavisolibacter sp.]
GLMANPDAKHYLSHDIFTYITSLPDPEKQNKDTASFNNVNFKVGDTVFYSKGFAIVEDVASFKAIPNSTLGINDSASVATIKVLAKTGSVYTIKPVLITKDGHNFTQPDTLTAENLIFQLQKVDGKTGELGLKESESLMKYVTLKAYKFPFINVLWLGTIIMIVGIMISMFRRRDINRLKINKL